MLLYFLHIPLTWSFQFLQSFFFLFQAVKVEPKSEVEDDGTGEVEPPLITIEDVSVVHTQGSRIFSLYALP